MQDISTLRDLINLWPTRADLARELSERMEEPVSVHRVHKWAEKNQAIPPRFHFAILDAGQARGFPVTADLIVRLHGPHRGAA